MVLRLDVDCDWDAGTNLSNHLISPLPFRRGGSVANSVSVTLLRGEVHLLLANLPWRQLQERAEKIPGDKKHVESMLPLSHCVAQFNTAHDLPNSVCQVLISRLTGRVDSDRFTCPVSALIVQLA
jgi:hypothetical protein